MKTGIIRRIDDLGRVVIPKEIRRKYNIHEGDPLEITLEEDKICFELYVPSCDYEDKINRIIESLENDDYLISSKEVITVLKGAIKILGGDNNAR